MVGSRKSGNGVRGADWLSGKFPRIREKSGPESGRILMAQVRETTRTNLGSFMEGLSSRAVRNRTRPSRAGARSPIWEQNSPHPLREVPVPRRPRGSDAETSSSNSSPA
ncbi:pr5.1 [rat cytomegalovirus strain Maastricht]|uniref:Pr5.1 n=1 Tax=Rat cytomegalovirus (strain Maastricht) TaxID=79700 RepID=Q9DWH2_RCMVM|nr:pr5.1 [rat cytomegalovirus strain Maastricht]AAF99117.1 pr5.1 [rat cytomegalovirus strain Maastricht]